MTRKTVSEMTYNVSSGTLNSTIPIPEYIIATVNHRFTSRSSCWLNCVVTARFAGSAIQQRGVGCQRQYAGIDELLPPAASDDLHATAEPRRARQVCPLTGHS